MAAILPRHVICVLGLWDSLDLVEEMVRRVGGLGLSLDREFSQLAPDSRMIRSFEASYDRVNPSMTEEDWQAVREHTAVAYVLSPPLPRARAADISGRVLLLIAELLRGDGVAAKGESSGITHGRNLWLELADIAAQATDRDDAVKRSATLYRAWVRRPLLDPEAAVLYSCGMHLLGEPDMEIESSLDIDAALEWIDLLGLYLVADRPARPIKDGEGFRLTDTGPRRIMRLRPCDRYAEDEFFFNPYGYTRLRLEPTEEG
jgi:hypothetical protein